MPIGESLIVTALGMAVVFVGLVLCIAFIDVFRRVAARVAWGGGEAGEGAASATVTETVSSEPVPPDVLAVIVAVLEVERALYVGRYRSRLTLTRHP